VREERTEARRGVEGGGRGGRVSSPRCTDWAPASSCTARRAALCRQDAVDEPPSERGRAGQLADDSSESVTQAVEEREMGLTVDVGRESAHCGREGRVLGQEGEDERDEGGEGDDDALGKDARQPTGSQEAAARAQQSLQARVRAVEAERSRRGRPLVLRGGVGEAQLRTRSGWAVLACPLFLTALHALPSGSRTLPT